MSVLKSPFSSSLSLFFFSSFAVIRVIRGQNIRTARMFMHPVRVRGQFQARVRKSFRAAGQGSGGPQMGRAEGPRKGAKIAMGDAAALRPGGMAAGRRGLSRATPPVGEMRFMTSNPESWQRRCEPFGFGEESRDHSVPAVSLRSSTDELAANGWEPFGFGGAGGFWSVAAGGFLDDGDFLVRQVVSRRMSARTNL
jgi:hypothetical protein